MIEARWFKRILYIVYTIGCAFSGYVIYYAAKNGTLYTDVFDHLIVKALILGIPAVLCFIFDMIYHSDMMEAFAWQTSIGAPIVCLLIGFFIIGDKQEISVFGLSISVSVVYILMYAISLVITYLTGLFAIWTGEDERPKWTPSPTHVETYTPPTTPNSPGCGAYGFPEEMGPNHLPDNLKGPY